MRQVERPAAPVTETAPARPPRVAGLPGADRRILRKRLARPLKFAEKCPQDARPAAL